MCKLYKMMGFIVTFSCIYINRYFNSTHSYCPNILCPTGLPPFPSLLPIFMFLFLLNISILHETLVCLYRFDEKFCFPLRSHSKNCFGPQYSVTLMLQFSWDEKEIQLLYCTLSVALNGKTLDSIGD